MCSCEDVAEGAVCGPSPGMVELCQRRRKRVLAEAGRQEKKCARCGWRVLGWRWWVHFEYADMMGAHALPPWSQTDATACGQDCFDQRVHGE